jgi:hypothetical protein
MPSRRHAVPEPLLWQQLRSPAHAPAAATCAPLTRRFSTDDVDDSHTERGRALIAREREAAARGFKLGEVLLTAYGDVASPTALAAAKSGARCLRLWCTT